MEQLPARNTKCYQSAFMWGPWKGFVAAGEVAVAEQRRNGAGEVADSSLSDSGGPRRHLFSTPGPVAIVTNECSFQKWQVEH